MNICYAYSLHKVVCKENIDVLIVSKPFGVFLTKRIVGKLPVIHSSHDVASENERIIFNSLRTEIKIFNLPIIKQISLRLFLWHSWISEYLACHYSVFTFAISETDRKQLLNKYHLSMFCIYRG